MQSIHVEASGHGALKYEWRRNGIVLEGEASANLGPAAFGVALSQIGDGDVLSVRVSNEFGSTVVVQPPEIGDPPIITAIRPNAATPETWVSILAVPPPGILIPSVSSSDGVPVVRITSPYIAYLPSALDPRWWLETAPTLEGSRIQARFDGMKFGSDYGDFR